MFSTHGQPSVQIIRPYNPQNSLWQTSAKTINSSVRCKPSCEYSSLFLTFSEATFELYSAKINLHHLWETHISRPTFKLSVWLMWLFKVKTSAGTVGRGVSLYDVFFSPLQHKLWMTCSGKTCFSTQVNFFFPFQITTLKAVMRSHQQVQDWSMFPRSKYKEEWHTAFVICLDGHAKITAKVGSYLHKVPETLHNWTWGRVIRRKQLH